MTTEKKHGGVRPGSGRKKGSGKGRTVISKTISMKKKSWERLDELRADLPRGKFIEENLKGL